MLVISENRLGPEIFPLHSTWSSKDHELVKFSVLHPLHIPLSWWWFVPMWNEAIDHVTSNFNLLISSCSQKFCSRQTLISISPFSQAPMRGQWRYQVQEKKSHNAYTIFAVPFWNVLLKVRQSCINQMEVGVVEMVEATMEEVETAVEGIGTGSAHIKCYKF